MIRTFVLAGALATVSSFAIAEGDAEMGERVFRKCQSCHQVGEGAENRTGPTLNNIVGAPMGAHPDFGYSDALADKAAEGGVWDVETLTAFLANPRNVMQGTRMSFAGLRKEQEIADVIAYLATFSE